MRLYKLILIIGLFVFCYSAAEAQILKIQDKTTGKAVTDVEIFSLNEESMVSLTNSKGEAMLDKFSFEDTLIVKHTSYRTLIITKKELKQLDYVLELFPGIVQLEETVVSANRWEQKREEVPVLIKQISVDEVKKFDPQTAADMLEVSGNVFVQRSQMGGGSPTIRGFATNRVLIVVDGIRMNNPIFRHGNLQNVISIDPNSLESSEIIFGPGSVIYGSDAIGGVMDFHTKKPKFALKDHYVLNGNALLRFNSGNNGKTSHIDLNIANDKISFVSSLTFSDFSELYMGKNGISNELKKYYTRDTYVVQDNNGNDTIIGNNLPFRARGSAYSHFHAVNKLKFKLNNMSYLEISSMYNVSSDIPRYDRLIQEKDGQLKYADWYYGPQKWEVFSINYQTEKEVKLWDEFKIQSAYQYYEESRHDRKLNSDFYRNRIEKLDMYSLNADAFKKLNANHALFYGMEASYGKIKSDAYKDNINTGLTEDIATRYPDNSDYYTSSLYTSYRWLLTPNLTLTGGARLNYVYAYSPFDDTYYDFQFDEIQISNYSPNGLLGIVYDKNNLRLAGNLSTGFRAPNIDDIGKVFDSEPGSVVVPNQNLNPEYAYNADINVSKSFGEIFRIEGSVFYTVLTSAMQRQDFQFNGMDSIMYDGEMSKVQAIQNTGRVDVYGVSAGIFAAINNNLSLRSHINYTQGEDQDGNPYRHVPPLFGNTHINFIYGKMCMEFWADYNGEKAASELSPEEHGKTHMYTVDEDYAQAQSELPEEQRFNEEGLYSPDWYTINFKFTYSVNKHLFLSAGALNITDQLYRPYSSGIPAMGRRFVISLKIGI